MKISCTLSTLTKLEHRAGGQIMNELDLTNTQTIILPMITGLLFVSLKHIESHKRELLEHIVKLPSKDLNLHYGRYIKLGKISKGGMKYV